MSAHKYPAVSSPQAQEARQDIVDRLQRYMEMWERTAQSWERQSNEWEQQWRDVTNELARVRVERDTAVAEQHRLFSGMVNAGRELDAARRWAHAWKRRARTWRPIARKALEVVRHERAAHIAYRLHAEAFVHENVEIKRELDAANARIAELERQLGETQQALGVAECKP